ncbi:hypothetical protein [Bacillus sp. JCM 19041]|uniref:hypothetical protein n=1 Tax=Bacillus sp. JCM 19041 TaxID=1460637 RepID=UPI0006D01D2D
MPLHIKTDKRRKLTLRTTIFLLVSAVVIVSLLVTDLLIHQTIGEEIEQNQADKAQQLARTVALTPVVLLIHAYEEMFITSFTQTSH